MRVRFPQGASGIMRNLLFYKYVEIEDLVAFRESHLAVLRQLHLKGKVLIAHEGINGCVTGTEEETAAYKQLLWADPRFSDLEFKDTEAPAHGFRKTIVRIRPEIVTSKTTVNLQNKAPYITPQELKETLDKNEDVILLDARNNYESAIGRFKNALTPDIVTFRQFTDVADQLRHIKDKPIVTYCTGGIRCEKASAVLKERGFTNVRQLHGGIIKYGEQVGSTHWEGKCFVFDTRGAINIDPNESEPIAKCAACNLPADTYYNCALVRCDKRFIACDACAQALEKHCCKKCRNINRKLLVSISAV
jgi:UPF0176 protein